jgi:Pyridoxamine 5'-phosphate oxidase
MEPIKITRPHFPPGYVEHPKAQVSWEQVAGQLREATHYWLCSVRPPSRAAARAGRADGRPHCVPRWGVYLDGKFYYDGSPETRHAQNILQNPHVSLHLESGEQAVILEGRSEPAGKPSAQLAERLSAAMCAKYADLGYAPGPEQWDQGGLYVFTPRQCIAWTVFTEDPTKFVFDDKS